MKTLAFIVYLFLCATIPLEAFGAFLVAGFTDNNWWLFLNILGWILILPTLILMMYMADKAGLE